MTEQQKDKKWYVLRAVSGKEKKAKEYIESEISRLEWQDYVAQVLIPTEKVYQIRKGKKVSKERNYFPGYILIEASLKGEIQHHLSDLPNVIGFLGSEQGGEPTPLKETEVRRILGKVDELSEQGEEVSVPFIIGETVKVVDGPFNNFSGVVEEINEDKKKLKVMVKIFGRRTPLELGFMQVEKE
ncbi:MAG: transcription termination/antitermination protein NusG [Bacteroidales bacterium]|nr:transcription termination/antitermination protein NusG [Bacteroidales bacterium]MCF8328362.1 transcription termination/antitermination protein NusG [Bacteroidales bacterium]